MDTPWRKWLLSETAVELTTEYFNPSGDAQARKPWPARIAGKMQSLRSFGWMTDQYAYGIAPKDATVVDGKLVLPPGIFPFSCVNPVDGVHRLTAARMLETDEGFPLFKIPCFLFEFGTPHSIWLPFAFARMEMNQYSDMYTTVDLLHVIQLVEKKREESGINDTPNPKDIHEAIYGKQQAKTGESNSQHTLTENMIKDFYTFYARLKSCDLLDFVSLLGSKNHSVHAEKCHSLLGNQEVTVFAEGKCFLAPLLRPKAA